MVSKDDVLIFGPVGFIIIIYALYIVGVFEAQMPGAGETCELPDMVCSTLTTFGFPAQWLSLKTFLFYSMIPILAIWLIIYGFLDRIRIFDKKAINGVLAFLIAFSMVPLGMFVAIVSVLFSVMGVYSVILFVILFFLGTGFFARAMWRGWKGGMIEREMGIYDLELGRLSDEMGKVKKERNVLESESNMWKKRYNAGKVDWARTQKELAVITKKMTNVQAKYEGLKLKHDQVKKQKGKAKKIGKRTKPD